MLLSAHNQEAVPNPKQKCVLLAAHVLISLIALLPRLNVLLVPNPVHSAQACLMDPHKGTLVLLGALTARLLVCPIVAALLLKESSVAPDSRLEACLLLAILPPL